MTGIATKDGRNVNTYTMTYRRLDIGTGRTPIPVAFEAITIKAGNGNGGATIYVGGANVDANNGYELTAGGSLSIGFIGLPAYHAANTVYVTSDTDGVEIFFIAYN